MRLIDADKLLRNTIYNPRHVPYIAESDVIFAPTVDVPDRKVGEWIQEYPEATTRHCSKCDFIVLEEDANNYCPNCGARMKGEDDDTD